MAGIAVKFSISVELIKRINRMYLNDIDIQPGQVLKVPSNTEPVRQSTSKRNCTKVETKQNKPSEPKTVNDFFKTIDVGISSSKSRLEKFDTTFLDRLESNYDDSSCV